MIFGLAVQIYLGLMQSAAAPKTCGIVVGLATHCSNFCIDTMLTYSQVSTNETRITPFRSTNRNVLLGDSVCANVEAGKQAKGRVKNVTPPNSEWVSSDSLFGFEFTLFSGGRSVSQITWVSKKFSPSSGRFGVSANLDSWSACKKRESCQLSLNFDGDSGALSGNCKATWIDSSITPSAKFFFRLDNRSPFPRKIISGNDTLIIRKSIRPPK